MKKIALIFLLLPCIGFSQSLVENKIDNFNKRHIKITSWENFVSNSKMISYFRITKIDTSYLVNLKLMIYVHFSMDKDQEMLLKLGNGDIVKLYNLSYEFSCSGCGAKGYAGSQAPGIMVSYFISKRDVDKIKSSAIAKVRVYTSKGYVEGDMKEKNYQVFLNSLKLVEP